MVSIIALLSSPVENVLYAVAAAMAVPGQGIGFRGAHPPRRKTGSWHTALPVLWVLFPVLSLAEGAYTFGQPRVGQQANFCLDEAAALAVADVFRDQGARPGYGALSQSPACRRRVLDFIPRAMLTRVEIEGDDRYWVNFVWVDLASGGRSVLVTTREIRRP